jgi:hypothetical protein
MNVEIDVRRLLSPIRLTTVLLGQGDDRAHAFQAGRLTAARRDGIANRSAMRGSSLDPGAFVRVDPWA